MRFEKLPPILVNFRGIFAFYSSADCRLPLVLSYTGKGIFEKFQRIKMTNTSSRYFKAMLEASPLGTSWMPC